MYEFNSHSPLIKIMKKNKYICKKCNKEFAKELSYYGHLGSHTKSKQRCNICENEFSLRQFKKHYDYCIKNNGKNSRGSGKGRDWAKGKTYEEIYGVEKARELKIKHCNSIKERHKRFGTKKHSKSSKEKISIAMKGNKNWENSIGKTGRGIKGTYKGYFCDSSWELAFVIYNLENNISFIRNKERFEYYLDNEKHFYIPDFKIDDTYIEIKGRRKFSQLDKKTKFKLNEFQKKYKLKILFESDMIEILNYCKNKYNNFIDLYDINKDINDAGSNPAQCLLNIGS